MAATTLPSSGPIGSNRCRFASSARAISCAYTASITCLKSGGRIWSLSTLLLIYLKAVYDTPARNLRSPPRGQRQISRRRRARRPTPAPRPAGRLRGIRVGHAADRHPGQLPQCVLRPARAWARGEGERGACLSEQPRRERAKAMGQGPAQRTPLSRSLTAASTDLTGFAASQCAVTGPCPIAYEQYIM